jgi:penicillin-binding protein 1A
MGVRSKLNPYPSAVLGTNDVTPLDMAAAYATFANRGVRVPPTFVTKITSRDGEILYQHKHSERPALEPEVADAAVSVLRQVVERGTGVGAKIGRPAAGKTGTGQEWRDAWFVGFTPQLVTSVWVGFPDRQISMVPPTTRTRVTGGSWPAQIWQLFMGRALANQPIVDFHAPPIGTFGLDEDVTPRAMPNVVGLTISQAERELARSGFGIRRKSVTNSEYPPGYVTAQSIAAGSNAPGGSVVVLTVATAPTPTSEVPSVLGQTKAVASEAIKDAGFQVEVVVEAEPDAQKAAAQRDIVWKQSPRSGQANKGSTITIWINPA